MNFRAANNLPILLAILAAACYGVSSPLSELLLKELSPVFMAALLYLGAGLGMLAVKAVTNMKKQEKKEARITKKEFPFVLGMIVLDIAAPILLMLGLTMTNSATVSLLNNFEIVATSVIALAIFKETIGRRLWIAITLITLSSILLSAYDLGNLSFSIGVVFTLLACVCWGFENNCTRMLSLKDPLQIVIIKGLGSGTGAMLIVAATKTLSANMLYILFALLLGFLAYGLSIYFYILAQRELGAARTSAYYAIAPFIGVGLSFVIFRQGITSSFVLALAVMILGTYFAAFEKHKHVHHHTQIEHEHRHNHTDGHHNHSHDYPVTEHSHSHTHETLTHEHPHTPDMHHTHPH